MDDENKKYIVKESVFLLSCNDKLKHLGYGEWVEEYDKLKFEYLGYECMVHRVFSQESMQPNHYFGGHLCGYVRVPDGHILFGNEEIKEIACHGGLTYSSNTSFSHGHWIGFDCAHSGDVVPSMELLSNKNKNQESLRCIQQVKDQLRKLFPAGAMMNPTYKNIDFCITECIAMVDQLIGIEKSAVKVERR